MKIHISIIWLFRPSYLTSTDLFYRWCSIFNKVALILIFNGRYFSIYVLFSGLILMKVIPRRVVGSLLFSWSRVQSRQMTRAFVFSVCDLFVGDESCEIRLQILGIDPIWTDLKVGTELEVKNKVLLESDKNAAPNSMEWCTRYHWFTVTVVSILMYASEHGPPHVEINYWRRCIRIPMLDKVRSREGRHGPEDRNI